MQFSEETLKTVVILVKLIYLNSNKLWYSTSLASHVLYDVLHACAEIAGSKPYKIIEQVCAFSDTCTVLLIV